MAYGLRDTFGTSISDDYVDDYGINSSLGGFMARSRRRKKTSNVRTNYKRPYSKKKKLVHRRIKSRVKPLSRDKKRPFPHHLKKYWFKKKKR